MNFVSQNAILCHKSQFCVTQLNFVSQNSILSHKSQFCDTKREKGRDLTQSRDKNPYTHRTIIQFCYTELNFVTQKSILCNKIEFCVTKFNSV